MTEEDERGPIEVPNQAAPAGIVRVSMSSARFTTFLLVFFSALIEFGVCVYAFEEIHGPGVTAERGVVIGVSAVILAAVCWGISSGLLVRARLNTARLLLTAGHFDAAMYQLKPLARKHQPLRDEATYTVALVYDRQGKTRLAEEGYKVYLKEFGERGGSWVMEARVRLEELAAESVIPTPLVQAHAAPAKPDLRCPFCKDTFLEDALTAECADCATPHHLACYEEQGGCSVYGCRSSTVKTRVRD